jgi:GT2 family glycosyltransferase
MSNAIFIAGYYRSGTSALSGALAALGVSMLNDADANEHNPKGFYESPELISFDIDLFQRLGVDWTDLRGLAEGWLERADMAGFMVRLDEILRRRFGTSPLWGIKHPHLCRTLPIYERVAAQAGHCIHAVHIFRDPWTIAASQHRKNGLSRAHVLLLWVDYLVSSLRQSRHLPRGFLTYQALMHDPANALRQLERDLGLELVSPQGLEAAQAYLTGTLDRSKPVSPEGLLTPLHALVQNAWEAVQARDFSPVTWDAFGRENAGLVGFLSEISSSRGVVVPGFGGAPSSPATAAAPRGDLRPQERVDGGAKQRLLARMEDAPALPRLAIIIAAPAGRAAAVSETLNALHAQWYAPHTITIVAAEPVTVPGHATIQADAAPGAVTAALCAALNEAALTADYVAVLNAGDSVAPDACLRFALAAAASHAAMLYCDEIVPRESGAWVRYKPGWDITRLRQAAFVGDWVWYRGPVVTALGGFDAALAGAEEYDLHLRLAEAGAPVERLPEALFTRQAAAKRDSITVTDFIAAAGRALTAHFARAGISGTVQNRQYPGLFYHARAVADPGTAIILLCHGAEIADLDRWMTDFFSGPVLSGPVILAGHDLSEPMTRYLTEVTRQSAALEGKVLAVPPLAGLTEAAAFAAALALADTEMVALMEARARPVTPNWISALRDRLADPGVVLAAGRALLPLGTDGRQFMVQGPIIIGADTRLGAGHLANDSGPGGWLTVDQEVSAVTPALLARREALAACTLSALSGDAFWIDLCAQLRQTGARLVWTPDVSYLTVPDAIQVDATAQCRQGSDAARDLPWEDPYHHPAFGLHGDLLASELRGGLVRSFPPDSHDILLTGAPEPAIATMSAVRALRAAGLTEGNWSPEPVSAGDINRRAASLWVRMNPSQPASPFAPPYRAVFNTAPAQDAGPAIEAASQIFATSPGLIKQLQALVPGKQVTLARPALSRPVWESFTPANGLNTRPRVLWIDEANTPPWMLDLINETRDLAAWIVAERAGEQYGGSISRILPPPHEQRWAEELASVAPQIFCRPAAADQGADHYPTLLAAAAGCRLLIDSQLDTPPTLRAQTLPNTLPAWREALTQALTNLPETLTIGRQTRQAALALPALEDTPPPWSGLPPHSPALRRAAE